MGLTVSRRKSKFFYRQPSKIQINIYYICSEIYHNIIWQINIICWKLLAIWLVGRFFSLVKIIVWPITGRERKSSQVKKIVSLFPPFHVCFLWEKEESDGVVFGHFKVRRYSFSQGIHRRTRKWEHKKKTEQSIALLQEFLTLKGVSRALEEIPPWHTQFIHQRIHYNSEKERRQRKLWAQFIAWYVGQLWKVFLKKKFGYSIIKNVEFEKAWMALKSKQKDLRKKGKGGKPDASVPLTENDVKLP